MGGACKSMARWCPPGADARQMEGEGAFRRQGQAEVQVGRGEQRPGSAVSRDLSTVGASEYVRWGLGSSFQQPRWSLWSPGPSMPQSSLQKSKVWDQVTKALGLEAGRPAQRT